jgi:L-asparagine transporter-like permease
VRNHGEFEFWFASTKVAAIVVFLFSGFVCVSGFWPGAGGGLSNLAACDGFLPNGIGPVLTGAAAAAGFYFGAVIVTIAAAESAEPERAVAKETNSVTTRVLIFCVGLFALVLMIVPWNDSSRIAARTSAPGMSSGPRSVSAHARGRPHGGALGPELGPLRVFQDSDGSGEEGRRAPGFARVPPTG